MLSYCGRRMSFWGSRVEYASTGQGSWSCSWGSDRPFGDRRLDVLGLSHRNTVTVPLRDAGGLLATKIPPLISGHLIGAGLSGDYGESAWPVERFPLGSGKVLGPENWELAGHRRSNSGTIVREPDRCDDAGGDLYSCSLGGSGLAPTSVPDPPWVAPGLHSDGSLSAS